jgi:glycosyltransferase involved in cell wall biosynthesis
MQHRPKVLAIVSHYLPGFKAGGPIRSLANLVAHLGDEFDFHIVTRDRDLGDAEPYSGVRPNVWQRVGHARVAYIRPSWRTWLYIARTADSIRPDLIYFNSFYDALWCALPLRQIRASRLTHAPVVIAARGQFGAGAMGHHGYRKTLYRSVFKALGLTNRVVWQATCEAERDDIWRVIGRSATVVAAQNISESQRPRASRGPKQAGSLNLAFYSRVSPKKNLSGAIELLRGVPGRIVLDVWGPVEDPAYERRCRQQIAALPGNIQVHWCGPVPPERVAETLARYDALFLPTLGENFGHAIIEALAAGCPVVISNRTPWQKLAARGVGWGLPLDSPRKFREVLTRLCVMEEREHEQMRVRSIQYAAAAAHTTEAVDAHRRMFYLALGPDRSLSCAMGQAA